MQNSNNTHHPDNTIHGIVGRNHRSQQKKKVAADASVKGTGQRVTKPAAGASEAEVLSYKKRVSNIRAKGNVAVR